MSWAISIDDMIIESTEDGLSSLLTPLINSWISSQDNMVNVEPYPSAVKYDKNDESMVLAAHLDFFESQGMGGPKLLILKSDVEPYDDYPDDSDEIELEFQ